MTIQEFLIFIVVNICINGLVVWAHGYFQKKGENYATKEDFDELFQQTKKITEATENIRSEVSYRNWHDQQHWALKEKYYMDILQHLTICKNSLLDRLDYFQEPGSEHDDACTKEEHFLNLSGKAFDSFSAIRVLSGPASVFLSETTIKNLEELDSGHWNIANHSALCVRDYLVSTLKLVDEAFVAVRSDACSDLNKTERGPDRTIRNMG